MLDSRTAFKVAFLKKCAEQGLTLEETHEVVKQALNQKQAGVFRDSFSTVKNLGLAAALAGPPIAGYAIGSTIPKLTDMEEQDVKDMKKRQLIEEYRRLARDMQNKKKRRL